MIRVLVKASSPLLQAGIEGMLRSMPEVELADGDDELAGPSRRLPEGTADDPAVDVVILESEGEEETADLGGLAGRGAVVLLLDEPSAAATAGALRAGVKAVLPRRLSRGELLGAVRAAAAGLVVLHPDGAAALLPTRAAGAPAGPGIDALTGREREILAMMAEGLANKEIAVRLSISEHTVKFHVASVMSKLGAVSRTEAVTLAIRRGLLLV